jgi:cbb3-type cytochrome oxidase subunit 1
MDRFVKNFIIVSILYLGIASIVGVLMTLSPSFLSLRYVHSHLMLLGWVTMMIYGVGYHILPRFAGKLIKNKTICEFQFYLANIGLLGLVIFYTLSQQNPEVKIYKAGAFISAFVEVVSSVVFLYVMLTILLSKEE